LWVATTLFDIVNGFLKSMPRGIGFERSGGLGNEGVRRRIKVGSLVKWASSGLHPMDADNLAEINHPAPELSRSAAR
jgi:hypothetical protein